MSHNLHSQFHVPRTILVHFQHIFNFWGELGLLPPTIPSLVPLSLLPRYTEDSEQSRQGISGVYNWVFILNLAPGTGSGLQPPCGLWSSGVWPRQLSKCSGSLSPLPGTPQYSLHSFSE